MKMKFILACFFCLMARTALADSCNAIKVVANNGNTKEIRFYNTKPDAQYVGRILELDDSFVTIKLKNGLEEGANIPGGECIMGQRASMVDKRAAYSIFRRGQKVKLFVVHEGSGGMPVLTKIVKLPQ